MFYPFRHVKPITYLEYIYDLSLHDLLPKTYTELFAKTRTQFHLKDTGALFTICSALDAICNDVFYQQRFGASSVFLRKYLTERLSESSPELGSALVKIFQREDASYD